MIEHYAPHNGRVLLDDDSIINIADVTKSIHDTDCIVTEDEEARQLRIGNSFAAGYVWSSVANGAVVALHIQADPFKRESESLQTGER